MAEKEPEKKTNKVRNEIRVKNTPVADEPVRKSKAADTEIEDESETATNSFRDKDSPKSEKKLREKKPATPRKSKSNPFTGFIERIRTDEKMHKIVGTFLVFIFTPYLIAAFASYFFSWQTDQDKVMGPVSALFSSQTQVSNILGKLGALISHGFIHKGFGIASFFFPFIGLLAGLRLMAGVKLLPIGKTFRYGLFALLVGSITLGYIFRDSYFYFGGVFGYEISTTLNSLLGAFGTGMLLLFTILVFLIVSFNLSFAFLKAKPSEIPIEADLETEELEFKNTIRNEEKEPEFEVHTASTENEEIKEPELVNSVELSLGETDESVEEKNAGSDPIELSTTLSEPTTSPEITDGDIQFTVEKKNEDSVELSIDEIDAKSVDLVREFGEYDPTLDLSGYQFPSIELLENYGGGKEPNVNTEELTLNKNRIVETLGNYGISIEKIKATIGPTVTLYEIIPAAGVRISKIKNLEDDIALSLSALGIRIIAPIPGKGTIGIEVPNMNPEMVPMRALMASDKFQNTSMDLPVALGKTISNEIFIADLSKMPHLLMAGATGQGKSVGLNAILVSLLYKKHPAQIKFVLVDPKKVELTLFNRIERHFLAKLPDSAESIITDTKKVVHTLNSLCIEMDTRYDLLKDAEVRNLKEYNAKFVQRKLNPNNGHRYLPYIVLVVDEFADLIMTAGKEVETPIARLAQLARAIGIHLIIATQRPSVNIITGTIKANFPSRIAFRVTSKIDSRTILDSGGAEQLIGKGDMLYSTGNDLIRLQCAFVDTPEVERITKYIGDQRGYPSAFLLPEYVDENGDAKLEIDESDRDSMFEEAARIVVQHQQGSASLLQRKLKLGYNRAGRIVDQLEAAGIIGPFEGSKAREVFVKDMQILEEKLKGGKNNGID
jgi:DNA segregation ATPase FtsK/SpoIIIE, S-DNA-T family